jgi:hypothetical protein
VLVGGQKIERHEKPFLLPRTDYGFGLVRASAFLITRLKRARRECQWNSLEIAGKNMLAELTGRTERGHPFNHVA